MISLTRGLWRQLSAYFCHIWNVVCFWRQLLALAVASRGDLCQGQASWLTAATGKQSYFHLRACISNSAESVLPLVPTPTLDTHIRAGNGVLALPALTPSWAPVWVARGLAGHCSTPGPPHHAGEDSRVQSSESTVPHAKCALRVIRSKWFSRVKWEQSSKGYQEALLTRSWLEKRCLDRSGGSWQDVVV